MNYLPVPVTGGGLRMETLLLLRCMNAIILVIPMLTEGYGNYSAAPAKRWFFYLYILMPCLSGENLLIIAVKKA